MWQTQWRKWFGNRRPRTCRPLVETLEPREVPAAGISLGGGTLTIRGGSAADRALVSVQGEQVSIRLTGSVRKQMEAAVASVRQIVFVGGGGNDRLIAEIYNTAIGSNTTLRGGTGSDTFVLKAQSGNHVIRDFENGRDKIDLASWADYDRFSDLPSALFRQDGDDVLMDLTAIGKTGRYRLENVDLDDIGASDFLF